jgi:hypothetical protein
MLKTISILRILMEGTLELSNVKVEATDGSAILISFRFYFLKLIEFKRYTYCSPET